MLPSSKELVLSRLYEAAAFPLPERVWMRLHLWRQLAAECCWWWPCEEVCLFCERPITISLDTSGRLHGEKGAALQFPDGWKIYAWHGVQAPADIIERPETLTPERIERETNIEARRMMIERFGEERFLEETGVKVVHADTYGTLYRRDVAGQEPILMVRVKNSTPEPDGTIKTYRLRVPPWIETAKEAVAWTFGLSEERYAPLQET
jgi:hypothetical protein